MSVLETAIRDASHERQLELQLLLSKQSAEANTILHEHLVVDDFDSEAFDSGEDNSSEVIGTAKALSTSPTRKRKRTASQSNGNSISKRKLWENCIQCEQEYKVTENDEESCQWHPGEMEADDEFWADHNPDVAGEIDDLKDECSEGFIWTRCQSGGEEDGCQEGKHRREP